jgi:hypothetical protein
MTAVAMTIGYALRRFPACGATFADHSIGMANGRPSERIGPPLSAGKPLSRAAFGVLGGGCRRAEVGEWATKRATAREEPPLRRPLPLLGIERGKSLGLLLLRRVTPARSAELRPSVSTNMSVSIGPKT